MGDRGEPGCLFTQWWCSCLVIRGDVLHYTLLEFQKLWMVSDLISSLMQITDVNAAARPILGHNVNGPTLNYKRVVVASEFEHPVSHTGSPQNEVKKEN